MKIFKHFKVFLLILSLAICGTCFVACTPLYEKAICKIDGTGKDYSSLAAAIADCPAGHSIYIYNDIDESQTNSAVTALQNKKLGEKVYVQYIIDKPITLQGVKQNKKYPKIFGSIITDLSDSDEIESFVTIKNLNIRNDYISNTDNSQNLPFVYAVEVRNGNISLNNCNISKTFDMDNETVISNNLSLLSGVCIKRKNIEEFSEIEYIYEIEDCSISGYDNFNDQNSSFGLSMQNNGSGYGNLQPFKVNYNDLATVYYRLLSNFSNNSTNFEVVDLQTSIYKYLSTDNQTLIKEDNFAEGSIVNFYGTEFGFESKTDFNVYGQMSFIKAKNVNFIYKNSSAKVSVNNEINVSRQPYQEN